MSGIPNKKEVLTIKKTIILIGLMIVLGSMMVSALTIVIDDFNHPDGEINSSYQNNLGYYYGIPAEAAISCNFLDETAYCGGGALAEVGNQFNFTDGYTYSFDFKMDTTESHFIIGNLSDAFGQYAIYINFMNGGLPNVNINTGFGSMFLANATENEWHHIDMLINNASGVVNITIDDSYIGNFAFIRGQYLSSIPYYDLINNGAGDSLYIDNFTMWDGCTPDWSCSGYEACVSPAATAACNETTDANACGESYTGNYSEFSTQACTYPSSSGSSSNKVVKICDAEGNCYLPGDPALEKLASGQNLFERFWAWLSSHWTGGGYP